MTYEQLKAAIDKHLERFPEHRDDLAHFVKTTKAPAFFEPDPDPVSELMAHYMRTWIA